MREEQERGHVSLRAYGRLVRRNREFRLLWFAQIVSELGDWLYSVAIYSLLFELTGSARSVATAIVLQVLPQVLISPVAGVVNDRLSRRKVMILADLARAGVVLGMLAVRSADYVWGLYLLLFLETCLWGLFEPARTAIVPTITGSRNETLVANALASTTWSLNLAIGSALGGVAAAILGREAVFLLNSLSFLVSAWLLSRMRITEAHAELQRPLRWNDATDFSPVMEGIHYVRRNPRLLAILLAKAGLGLLSTHWVLLPVFGERVFPLSWPGLDPSRAGMLGMSVLLGSRGVGALVGSLAAGIWAGNREERLRTGILYGFLISLAGYAALAFAPNLWCAVLTVVSAHGGGSAVWVFSTTLLHAQADDRFRGRVFSADFAMFSTLMSAVNYGAGTLTDAGVSVRALSMATAGLGFIPVLSWWLALRLWRGSGRQMVPNDNHA